MTKAFEKAFEDVIGLEGGYVNDPKDPGGETKFGISKRSYPKIDIKDLSLEEANGIYKRDFWDKLRLDKIDPEVAREIFEVAVNAGLKRSVRITQRALNYLGEDLEEDGLMGPKTRKAIQKWVKKDKLALLKVQNGEQYLYYKRSIRRNPKLHRFARGWLRRIDIPS